LDKKTLVVLILAAMVPMIPSLQTAVPLQEIFVTLAEMMT
jgi:hypothetical protein